MLEPVLLLFALVLGLLWLVKRFVTYDQKKERQRTREFLEAYHDDKPRRL